MESRSSAAAPRHAVQPKEADPSATPGGGGCGSVERSKRCTGCQEMKLLSEYGRVQKSADGKNSRCKECIRTAAAARIAAMKRPSAPPVVAAERPHDQPQPPAQHVAETNAGPCSARSAPQDAEAPGGLKGGVPSPSLDANQVEAIIRNALAEHKPHSEALSAPAGLHGQPTLAAVDAEQLRTELERGVDRAIQNGTASILAAIRDVDTSCRARCAAIDAKCTPPSRHAQPSPQGPVVPQGLALRGSPPIGGQVCKPDSPTVGAERAGSFGAQAGALGSDREAWYNTEDLLRWDSRFKYNLRELLHMDFVVPNGLVYTDATAILNDIVSKDTVDLSCIASAAAPAGRATTGYPQGQAPLQGTGGSHALPVGGEPSIRGPLHALPIQSAQRPDAGRRPDGAQKGPGPSGGRCLRDTIAEILDRWMLINAINCGVYCQSFVHYSKLPKDDIGNAPAGQGSSALGSRVQPCGTVRELQCRDRGRLTSVADRSKSHVQHHLDRLEQSLQHNIDRFSDEAGGSEWRIRRIEMLYSLR